MKPLHSSGKKTDLSFISDLCFLTILHLLMGCLGESENFRSAAPSEFDPHPPIPSKIDSLNPAPSPNPTPDPMTSPSALNPSLGCRNEPYAYRTPEIYSQEVDPATGIQIPDFASSPDNIAIRNGRWSVNATWSKGRPPIVGEIVKVPVGIEVLYDLKSNDTIISIGIHGNLRFSTDQDTRLIVGTLQVFPGGFLEVGSKDNPVPPNLSAEIIIADQPLDLIADPAQYGTGLIILGKVTMHGSVLCNTFIRAAREMRSGDTLIQLESPAEEWRAGDRIAIPDTRQLDFNERNNNYVPQYEELKISEISADHLTLTIDRPLLFNHLGAKDHSQTLRFLPHIANLSRNVTVQSQSPNGTRGHIFATQGADVDLRYVTLKELGRTRNADLDDTTFGSNNTVTHLGTNQRGRYPLHFHHVHGPHDSPANGYQFTLIGNSLDQGRQDHLFKWSLTLHCSHFGMIRNNVIYNASGAGISLEEGCETGNHFESNFVLRVLGDGSKDDETIDRMGRGGIGFWSRGPNNRYIKNTVANARGGAHSYGFTFFGRNVGFHTIPNFPGADHDDPSQSSLVNMNALPLLEFRANEVYGATPNGLSAWWLGMKYRTPLGDAGSIKNFTVWHHHQWGYFGYEANNLEIDGFTALGDQSGTISDKALGMWFADYMQKGLVIKNAEIEGMDKGIEIPGLADGLIMIRDSQLRNDINIYVMPIHSTNTGSYMPPRYLEVRNVYFESPNTQTPNWITMAFSTTYRNIPTNLTQTDEVRLFAPNGDPTLRYRIYYQEQTITSYFGELAPASAFAIPEVAGGVVVPLP